MRDNYNARGQFHAFEVMLIFLAWLLLLASVWNHSAQLLAQQESQFAYEKAHTRAQAHAQTLIEQHHSQPWQGCAYFDEGKKRTRTHTIEKTCLQRLATTAPNEGIAEVYVRTRGGKEIFFTNPTRTMPCSGVERLVRVHETNEVALVGVISCAE